jgi:hypothetical protein
VAKFGIPQHRARHEGRLTLIIPSRRPTRRRAG